jgi:hypothetical protein
MSKDKLYRISYFNQDKVYEIYARHVGQSELFGFIEVSQLVFGEKSALLVDPSEEKLKSEFDGVNKFHILIQSVIRIDEVEKQGTAKIKGVDTKSASISSFPGYLPDTPKKS